MPALLEVHHILHVGGVRVNFLQHLDTLCTEQNVKSGIIWNYSDKTTVPKEELAKLQRNVRFHEGVPQKF